MRLSIDSTHHLPATLPPPAIHPHGPDRVWHCHDEPPRDRGGGRRREPEGEAPWGMVRMTGVVTASWTPALGGLTPVCAASPSGLRGWVFGSGGAC